MIGGVLTILGFVLGIAVNRLADYFLYKAKKSLDKNESIENVKILLSEMLNHRSYTDRSFESLRRPIGGYSDDEIRKILHELNAKKVFRGNDEWWYSRDREDERNAKRNEGQG